MKILTTPILLASLFATLQVKAQDDGNLFPEGDFESVINLIAPHPSPSHADKLAGEFYLEPGDYKAKGCKVVVENEGGTSFLRFSAPTGFKGILRTYIALDLPDPAPASLTISQRWRTSQFAPQAEAPAWASAQNDPAFILADGTEKVMHGTLRLTGDTGGGWVEVEKTVMVPEGAKRLILQPGLYGVTGTLDIDDIKVFAE